MWINADHSYTTSIPVQCPVFYLHTVTSSFKIFTIFFSAQFSKNVEPKSQRICMERICNYFVRFTS